MVYDVKSIMHTVGQDANLTPLYHILRHINKYITGDNYHKSKGDLLHQRSNSVMASNISYLLSQFFFVFDSL